MLHAHSLLNNSPKQQRVAAYQQHKKIELVPETFGISSSTAGGAIELSSNPSSFEFLKQVQFNIMYLGPERRKKIGMKEKPRIPVWNSFKHKTNEGNEIIERENVTTALAIEDAENFIKSYDAVYEDNESRNLNDKNLDLIDNCKVLISCSFNYGNQDEQSLIAQSLIGALFPSSLYLIVDKNMELQPKLLREFSKFSNLSEEDGARQVLVVFGDPRQAKRLCGRTQRVIKLPDPSLLGRTASYLLVRGITRILLDGSLYSLD
uniref:Uncharacterized protein n=1 Tax=Paulinella longichromatophora TaxID=1708747 RepID=A0A2H4ZNT8_9EUKA|nr:hypothetical protein PLO_209 [Paulinella longichromatophora]